MKKEIIWTTRPIENEIQIGFAGGPMYQINQFKLQRALWNREIKDTPEDVLKFAIKESQYIDFEEIPFQIR
jgi:hypothetical protein